jgi:hypothetical protein
MSAVLNAGRWHCPIQSSPSLSSARSFAFTFNPNTDPAGDTATATFQFISASP